MEPRNLNDLEDEEETEVELFPAVCRRHLRSQMRRRRRRSSSPKTKRRWSSDCRAQGARVRRGGLAWLGGVARARPVAAASLVRTIAQVAARFLATGIRPCVARREQPAPASRGTMGGCECG
uniref:Uncharacterized protein n=1 Tax=Arundo donax TaxID=35708 RepID=A0A0A9BJW1_ARUDO